MNLSRRVVFFAALLGFAAVSSAFAGVAARVNQPKVNVRGLPSFLGEVITQVQKGEEVVILEEITSAKPKPGEPTNWAKIKMPANTPVWVFANFLDGAKVKARRLNLRAGPGENYSVVGRLEKGDEVKPIRTVDEWVEVETPEQAYAFIDAALLDIPNGCAIPKTVKEELVPAATLAASIGEPSSKPVVPDPAPVETAKIAEPAPVKAAEPAPQVVAPVPAETKKIVAETVQAPSTPAPTPAPVEPAPAPVPANLPVVAAPAIVEASTPVKRIVRREGVVRTTRWNIQAPTYFALESSETGVVLNYLHAEKSDIKLKDFLRRRVVVTGEEMIDPRFEATPVLELETLEAAP